MDVRQLPVTGDYELARPTTLAQVSALLDEHGDRASLLCGGTDLLVQLRAGKITPRVVVDLKRVRELSAEIVERDGVVEIGCLVKLSDLIDDERIRRSFPVLVEAAETVGSIQIRNRASLVGNICNASPAADTVPALLVHRAEVVFAGAGRGAGGPADAGAAAVAAGSRRTVPLDGFFVGPGKTVRKQHEVVAAVRIPLPAGRVGAAFDRLTRRRGVDLATINLACLVDDAGRTRFAFGAVGPTPVVAEESTGRLADPRTNDDERARLLEALLRDTRPITDVRGSKEYRAAMLLVFARRTLKRAIERRTGR